MLELPFSIHNGGPAPSHPRVSLLPRRPRNSFSIWFFYLVLNLQGGRFHRLGIASTERLSYFEYSQTADFSH